MRTILLAITLAVVLGSVIAPTVAAAPPEPQCLQIYRDYDYGIVRYQSPNSCESHVWIMGQQVF